MQCLVSLPSNFFSLLVKGNGYSNPVILCVKVQNRAGNVRVVGASNRHTVFKYSKPTQSQRKNTVKHGIVFTLRASEATKHESVAFIGVLSSVCRRHC